jgi:hypothetical protein
MLSSVGAKNVSNLWESMMKKHISRTTISDIAVEGYVLSDAELKLVAGGRMNSCDEGLTATQAGTLNSQGMPDTTPDCSSVS